MGTGRKFAKKPATRPTKSASERRRRDRIHEKRLIALGYTEAQVKRMTSRAIRTLLLRPAKAAALAKAAKK